MRFNTQKTNVSPRRFFWVPTKLCILRNIPCIRNLMCHIFYSTYADASMYQGSSCRCYTLLLQLLKSKNSVQTCFEINNTFALGQVRDLLLARTCPKYYFYSYYDFWLEWDVSETGRQVPTISIAAEGLGEMCFPAGLNCPWNSPFWKSSHIWRYTCTTG